MTDETAAKLDRAKWKIFAILSVASIVADQATKVWARATLPVDRPNCSIPYDLMAHKCQGVTKTLIDGFWNWRLSMNPGSAFGLFSNQEFARWLLSIVGIGAVGGMVWMLKKARSDQKILHWALGLVAGGAVGNLIDRMYFGQVTDFVLWHYQTHEWPVFNVADVVLVVGVGLMFIDIQIEGKREKAQKKAAKGREKAAGLVKDLRE